jgi:hypothetical protein
MPECYVRGCGRPALLRIHHRRFGDVQACPAHDPVPHGHGIRLGTVCCRGGDLALWCQLCAASPTYASVLRHLRESGRPTFAAADREAIRRTWGPR